MVDSPRSCRVEAGGDGFAATWDEMGGDLTGRVAREWPLPGSGRTLVRWSLLAGLAVDDLVVARLVEAHADAIAIMAEIEGGRAPVPAGGRWGVWAAEGPGSGLTATALGDGWRLDGVKPWCSGATLLTHALVTAAPVRSGTDVEPALAAGERRLFAVDLDDPGLRTGPDEWASTGMRRCDTRSVEFDGVRGRAVGAAGEYLRRPGFWIGGIGVAACWYGGAVAVAEPLRRRVARGGDPHAAAHLGGVDVALGASRDALRAAAVAVDAEPGADHGRLARRVRATVAGAAAEVMTRVGRALGPAPLASDRRHASQVADLEVYIRQEHAERDLAALGAAVAAAEPGWLL